MPCGELRAAGEVGGRHAGSGSRRCEERLVSGAVPLPATCPRGAVIQDPLPVCPGHGRCGHGRPSTGPTACALASRRCALWGWREGVAGGVPCAVVRGV